MNALRLIKRQIRRAPLMWGGVALVLLLGACVYIFPHIARAWVIYVYPISYTPVIQGGYTTLSWNAPTADSCTISGSTFPCYTFFGQQYCAQTYAGQSGSAQTGPVVANTPYNFACTNVDDGGGGGDGQNSLTVVPIIPTTINLSVSQNSLPSSNSGTTLSWSGTQGTYFGGCTLSGGQWGSGTAVGINGSTPTAALAATTQYTVTCADSYIGPVFDNETVAVGAGVTADMTASATTIGAGQSVTLNFRADSATAPTACQINDGTGYYLYATAGCPASANASYNTGPINTPGTYSYTFYYYQSAWVAVKTLSVTVVPACTLSASPNPVTSGAATTLTYTTQGATGASIDQGVGTLPGGSGAAVVYPFSADTNWVVPSDWNNTNNTIEVIAGGGGGSNGTGGTAGAAGTTGSVSAGAGGRGGNGGNGGQGGGGGAYSRSANVQLVRGSTIAIRVGAGGTVGGGAGGDSYVNGASCAGASVCAKGGGAITGGQYPSGVGQVRYSGGNGAAGTAGATSAAVTGASGSAASAGGAGGAGGGAGGAGGPTINGMGGHASGATGGTGSAGTTAAGANGTQFGAQGAGGGGNGAAGTTGGAAGAKGNFTAGSPGGTGGTGGTGGAGGNYGGGGAGGAGGAGGGGGGGGGGFGLAGGAGGAAGTGGAGGVGRAGFVRITNTPSSFNPNSSVASPTITTTPTTFTMTATHAPSGLTAQCSVQVTITDVCADISGFQSSVPASPCITPTPPLNKCIPTNYTWNGSACIPMVPTNLALSGSRVRKGSPAVLNYSMQNPVGTCTISAPGYTSSAFTAAASGSHTTTGYPINAATVFTLSCGTASATANVTVTPTFIEQ